MSSNRNEVKVIYKTRSGMIIDIHPINLFLEHHEKVSTFARFEEILQRIRNRHDKVEDAFNQLQNVLISAN